MILVAGKCARCGKYYELPRQGNEAHCYINLLDDAVTIEILCVNSTLCAERQAARDRPA